MYYWESKVKTLQELKELGLEVINDVITRTTLAVTAHFGNAVSFVINASEDKQVISLYNSTSNIGHMLRAWVEFFENSQESGVVITQLQNFPVRLIYNPENMEYVGFGHFMKDRFMLYSDFILLSGENEPESTEASSNENNEQETPNETTEANDNEAISLENTSENVTEQKKVKKSTKKKS